MIWKKDYWTIIGGCKDEQEFKLLGKMKFQILLDCKLTPNSTLLDIGCGTGILIESLEKHQTSPKNYVGVDISNDATEFCRKHYPEFEFHTCEMTRLPKLDRRFDVICLYSVLTHMYPSEILALLIDIKQYLNEKGVLVVSVILNQTISTCTGTRSRMEINEEYFFNLIKSAGFSRIVRESTLEQEIFKISQ